MSYLLELTLESDTTFGRGDGVAGVVDQEIEYDPTTGFPFVRGRTLKGLLVESCADVLFGLSHTVPETQMNTLMQTGRDLFGSGGSSLGAGAKARIGAALLPKPVRDELERYQKAGALTPVQTLEALTAIRRQTAMDDITLAPAEGSLRASRVVLRGTAFLAPVDFLVEPTEIHLTLLAACAAGTQRAGVGRNRGRGKIKLRLVDSEHEHMDWLTQFAALIGEGKSS